MASYPGIKAGKAFVLIEAIDKTGKVLDGIRQRIGRFASEMSAMGQMMALRAAAALTPVGMSLNTYASFDDSLRKVEARSRGTGEELAALRKQAKDLGRTTAFTASHIGELQARLAQFGKNRNEIGQMTEPIMLLARAGGGGYDLGTDIMQATDAVTQVLSSFRMETEDTAHVADVLTAAVNNSKFSLEELGTSLQFAAPISKEFDMSLEKTIALLAAMRELGYDASIAGTALRNMQQRMAIQKGRDRFNEQLSELTGKTIEFTKAGKLDPLAILMQMQKALQGVDTVDAVDMLSKLMEMRATGPALGLKGSADSIAKLLTALENVEGTAKRTHDAMEKGLGGFFRELQSAVEGVAISLGETLTPMLLGTRDGVLSFLQGISAFVERYAGYVAVVVAGIAAFGLAGLSLIALGQIIISLTAVLGVVTGVTTALTGAMLALMSLSPTALIAMGIALAAIAMFGEDVVKVLSKGFAEVFEGWESSIATVAEALKTGDIEGAFEIIVLQMQVSWMKFINMIRTSWEGLNKLLGTSNNPFAGLPTTMDEFIYGKENVRAFKSTDSHSTKLLKMYDKWLTSQMGPSADRAKTIADWEAKDAAANQEAAFREGEAAWKDSNKTLSAEEQARKDAIDALEQELEFRKGEAAFRSSLEQPGPEDSPELDSSAWQTKLAEMANSLRGGMAGAMEDMFAGRAGGGSTAPDIIEAIGAKTTEAFRAIQQARYNMTSAQERAAKAAEEMLGKMDTLIDAVEDIPATGGV